MCVGPLQQLPVGQANCAMEFLSATWGDGLLGHLLLAPDYMVTYQQQGFCVQCNTPYQQVGGVKVILSKMLYFKVYPHTKLPLALPWSQAPVDLRPLVAAALANPIFTNLTCLGMPGCGPQLLQCQLVPGQGEVEVIHLVRHTGQVRFFFAVFFKNGIVTN